MNKLNNTIKVLIFTRYTKLGSSSRLRFYQYIKPFNNNHILTVEAPFFNDNYINELYFGKISYINVLLCYVKRLLWFRKINNFDVIWIEKEVFPWLPPFFDLLFFSKKVKVILDYDDAVYHRYDLHTNLLVKAFLSKKIASIMKESNLVIAGNSYIANYAISNNVNAVKIIPTVIDSACYYALDINQHEYTTIGWIGAPSTVKFISYIEPALMNLYKIKKVKFLFVGIKSNPLNSLPVDILEWSESTEIENINKMDIGIMPLPNEPFEKGKCGYKLIQYMACGKVVVASPVGVNSEIIEHGVNGYLASSNEEWLDCLIKLVDDIKLRKLMGAAGLKKIHDSYSLKHSSKLYIDSIKNIIK